MNLIIRIIIAVIVFVIVKLILDWLLPFVTIPAEPLATALGLIAGLAYFVSGDRFFGGRF